MICPKCGEQLPENAKFCGACGSRLAPEAISVEELHPVPEEKSAKAVSYEKSSCCAPLSAGMLVLGRDLLNRESLSDRERGREMARGQRVMVMNKFHSMVRVMAVTCILCLLLAACGMSTEEQWQEQYDLGQQYLLEGDYEQAIVAFTAAIEIDPNVVDAYLGRAEAYLGGDIESASSENLNLALADYDVAIELDETLTEAFVSRGDIHVALGTETDLEEAISDYSSAIALDDTQAEYYIRRGDVYAAPGTTEDLEEAVSDYTSAISLDDTNVEVYVSRGDVYMALADLGEDTERNNNMAAAVTDYEAAIILDDSLTYLYLKETAIYVELGDYAGAVKAYTNAIEAGLGDLEIYLSRAEAYYELAQEKMNAAVSDEETSDDLSEAAAEYLNAALEDYLTVLELGDTSESTYLDAVQICITLGEYDQAAELLEAGAQVNPDSAEIEQMSAELADLIEERAQQELVEAQRQELEETYWDLLMQVVDLLERGLDAIGSSDWFGDDYRAFCAELTTEVIWELDKGLYLGVYPGGYVYYGEMEEGQRSGYGSWFYCYSSSDEPEGMYKSNAFIPASTVYEGEWANDAPNGWGTLADWYQIVNVSTQDYEFDSYELNFVDGVGDGAGTMVYMFHSTGYYYVIPNGECIPEGEYYEECEISVVNGELQEIHQFGTGGPYAAVFDDLWNDTYYYYAVIESDYRVVRVSGL